jgi:hypothetical protein
MSAQVAMMAGMAGMSAFSSVMGGDARAGQLRGQADQQRLAGASLDAQASEMEVKTQNEELQRRKGVRELLSRNIADAAIRGVSNEQGSSGDVIADFNMKAADEDVANIRFMGENAKRRLSFGAENARYTASSLNNMAGMASLQGWMGAVRTLGMAGYSIGYYYGGSTKSTGPGGPSGSATT